MIENEVDVSKLTFEQLEKIRGYLKKLIDNGGSDLHVKANSGVRARINGTIIPFSGSIFSYEDAMTLSKEMLRSRFIEFVDNKEIVNDDITLSAGLGEIGSRNIRCISLKHINDA